MKFLIPNFASPDTFVDNVAETLRAMGHDVRTLPPISNAVVNSPAWRLGRLAVGKVFRNARPYEERWLLKTARRVKPDVVLALTQALSEETLFELKRIGVGRRIVWWGDPPANMTGMGLLTGGWDAIFVKDRDAVAKLRRVGLNADLLHEAMNPRWHRPIAEQQNDQVVVAGNFYGYRQFLVMRLFDAGVPLGLYGGRLPRWVAPEIARQHSGRYVTREEKSRVFGAALACLNSTSMAEGNSLNCRAFEIAGAGGLQLLEYRSVVTECFEPGAELLTFDSIEELLSQVEWARRDPQGVKRIRAAGARRAHAEHTYERRLAKILELTR